MYSGRMADTDSEEMSVAMLTMPSHRMTGESRKATPGPDRDSVPASVEFFLPPVRSAIEMYTVAYPCAPGAVLSLSATVRRDASRYAIGFRHSSVSAVNADAITISIVPSSHGHSLSSAMRGRKRRTTCFWALYQRPLRGLGWQTGQV